MTRHYPFLSFFQAEDGIRDLTVTGVQTCALPISARSATVSTLWGSSVAVSASFGLARGTSRHTSYASNLAPVIPSAERATATWRASSSQFTNATVHQRGAPSTTHWAGGCSRRTLQLPPAPPPS